VAGVVLEQGGLLSHSAVVAREVGVPCVVQIKAAMHRIPDGATITIHGDNGTVRIHK